MGLDQYAYTKNAAGQRDEISYWRKHPNLQGWMKQLWYNKQGPVLEADEFNCVELELTEADLIRFRMDLLNGRVESLGETGFFFGEASDEYYRNQDLEFVDKALELVRDGTPVYYNSWW